LVRLRVDLRRLAGAVRLRRLAGAVRLRRLDAGRLVDLRRLDAGRLVDLRRLRAVGLRLRLRFFVPDRRTAPPTANKPTVMGSIN